MLTLAPVIQQWVSEHRVSGDMVEVCTSEGSTLVSLDSADPAGHEPAQKHQHQSGCPYCHLKCHSLVWAPRMAFAEPAMAPFVAPLFLHAPQPLFAWVHVRSRAPPVFS